MCDSCGYENSNKKKKQNLFKISKWFTWESQIVRKIVISWFKIQSQNNELWTKSKREKYKISLLQDTFHMRRVCEKYKISYL